MQRAGARAAGQALSEPTPRRATRPIPSWLLIPLSLPFMWLLFPFSRRFRLYDHVVFVTYSLGFMTLLVALLTMEVIAG